MKHSIILTFILLTRLSAQDYFPLEVGNTWTYLSDFSSIDTTQKLVLHITDSLYIGTKKYFLYGIPNYFSMDTIRKDIHGNIWKIVKGTEYLLYDFSKDSGATYTFPDRDPLYEYEVKVFKYYTVQTYQGTYMQCIQLFFDIPQFRDADSYYYFAPNVGPIEMYGGESPHYRLYSVVLNGLPVRVSNGQQSALSLLELMQNYPNPFNPTTTIDYKLYDRGFVTLSIFDILGRQVTTLVNKYQNAGSYKATFDGVSLTSGPYFYSLKSGSYSIIKKCLLLK